MHSADGGEVATKTGRERRTDTSIRGTTQDASLLPAAGECKCSKSRDENTECLMIQMPVAQRVLSITRKNSSLPSVPP
jgi:hypothetical protein